MKLKLSEEVSLPLDAVTQAIGYLGRRGTGKSYAATKMAELMLDAGAQVVALDPVGVWYGLRLGEHGYDIPVLGGLHGDIPLEPSSGSLIASLIVERRLSAVLDVSQMTSAEQARFAADFAVEFFQRKKAAPSAVHVFLEECQEFAPQNHQRGEERMLHAYERLVKLGRNFGIGVSLISQRPQEVNKKCLNQTELLLVFQMTGPQERKAVEGWIADKGIDEDIAAMLPKLAVGEPHLWSPQWLGISQTVHIAKKRSLDASSTPKVGAKERAVQALSPIDLEWLRGAMVKTIERAKVDDPRELRRRIAELEKQVKAHPPAPPAPAPTVVPVLTSADIARVTALTDVARELRDQLGAAVHEIVGALQRAEKRVTANGTTPRTFFLNEQHELPPRKMDPQRRPIPALEGPPKETLRQKVARTDAGLADRKISGGERRIMAALAQHGRIGKSKLACVAGYSANGGGFNNILSALRTAGLIEGIGELELTPLGRKAVGPFDPLPTGRDLVEFWKRDLPKAERLILDCLYNLRVPASKEELARGTGYEANGGGFGNALSRLRTLGLISGRSSLTMADVFFE